MVLWKILTAVLLIFFIYAAPSTAEIKSVNILSDNRPMILFQMFGFTRTGNITLGVSSVSVDYLHDPSRLGFFIVSDESAIEVLLELQQHPRFCILNSNFIELLFTFQDLLSLRQSSFRRSYSVLHTGEYSLFFANCNPESSFVTMDVRTEMFNYDDEYTKDYLSHGLTHLPSLYFTFSLIYLFFLGFWMYVCFRNQQSVHQVHRLMSVLLITKALVLIFAALDKHYVKVTGTPHGWNVLFHVFRFMNNMLSFIVIALIGAGWPSLKQSLLKREKEVLIIVITLQVLANVAFIVIYETGPFNSYWVTWNLVFFLLEFICCCVIMLPIMWSIRLFSKTVGKVARNNLIRARMFCVVVIGYLLSTRIGVFALKMIVDYKKEWVCSAREEIASLVFYLVMFYMFRPIEKEDEYVVFEVEDVGE